VAPVVVVSVVVGTCDLKTKKKKIFQKSNIHLTNLGTINYRQKFMDVSEEYIDAIFRVEK
jgi:hypothetical protein